MCYFKRNILSFFVVAFVLLQGLANAVASNVNMKMDSNGNTIAVWLEDTLSGYQDVMASVLPLAGSWSTPINLSSSSGGINVSSPKIAINSSGNAVVVWLAYNTNINYPSLYGATLSALTTWSATTQISDNNEFVYDNYHVKLSDNNDMVVVWSSFSFSVFSNLIRSISDTFGSWSAPVTVAP